MEVVRLVLAFVIRLFQFDGNAAAHQFVVKVVDPLFVDVTYMACSSAEEGRQCYVLWRC